MKPLELLQIAGRVMLIVLVYGTIGAFLFGSLAVRIIELTMLLLAGKTFGFSWIGFLLGAAFLGGVTLQTGVRRDQWETFQMIFGGCVAGGIRAAFLGGLVALVMFTFWGDILTELMMSRFIPNSRRAKNRLLCSAMTT